MVRSERCAWIWTIVWAWAFATLTMACYFMAEDHLIYSLDDPYIHLAIAKNILHGGYGVNLHEYASPSSSILYPLLLALTMLLGLHSYGPLLINFSATGLSVWLMLEFFWRRGVGTGGKPAMFAHIVSPFLILAISGLALPLTGMEHSLHVLAVIATMRGLATLGEDKKLSLSLILGTLFLPFIRFEGIALATASVFLTGFTGKKRIASFMALAILLGMGVWAVIMARLGLPFLPGSVLSKSAVASSAHGGDLLNLALGMINNFLTSSNTHWGTLFLLAICAFLPSLQNLQNRAHTDKGDNIVALAAITSIGAHLVGGNYGWFYRYEVYAVAVIVMSGLYLFRYKVALLCETGNLAGQTALIALLVVITLPYIWATYLTPLASRNMYEQQYQMHRFARDFFPHNVAVNDLGWVAYNNQHYVLDLWGLGSERVRKIRAAGQFNTRVMNQLTKDANVDYAMVYGAWFPEGVPKDWCLMAVMDSEVVSAGSRDVMFYATNANAMPELSAALDRFAPTLPARVRFSRVRGCS